MTTPSVPATLEAGACRNMRFSKADLERLLAHPDLARARTGRFACFQMIPVEDRIGEWRFAGTADNLDEALQRCGALVLRIWPPPDSDALTAARVLAEWAASYELEPHPRAWRELLLPDGAEAVFVAQGGAPFDAIGTAIFELPEWGTLRERPIEDQVPPPPDEDDWDLDDDDET